MLKKQWVLKSTLHLCMHCRYYAKWFEQRWYVWNWLSRWKCWKFIKNYGTETFMPSLLSTLETIRKGISDELKKKFTGMTINILWTTILDPRCRPLRHLNRIQIQAAKNKLIKRKSAQRKTMAAKEKPSRFLISLMLHRKQCHHHQQQQIILKWRGQKNCFDKCLGHRSWELLGLFCN